MKTYQHPSGWTIFYHENKVTFKRPEDWGKEFRIPTSVMNDFLMELISQNADKFFSKLYEYGAAELSMLVGGKQCETTDE